MPRLLLLILGLSACVGDKSPDDSAGGEVATDSGSSDDGGDSGSHGGDTDTGGSSSSNDLLTVLIEGESEGLSVGISSFWIGTEGIMAGSVLSSSMIDEGIAELVLPEIIESDLSDDGTGALMGSYVIHLWFDTDGDGLQDEDESIHGLAETRLLFLAGVLGEENEALGVSLGWNAVWFDMRGELEPILYDLDSVPAEINLIPNEQQTVAGTSDVPETPADPIRITALPLEIEITEEILAGLIFDEQLLSTWSVSVEGSPDVGHMVGEEGKIALAQERLLAYVDIDESEGFTVGDESLYGVCFDGKPVLLLWMNELTTVVDAITASMFDLQVGWSVAAVHPEGLEPPLTLDADQVTQLSAENSCSLD